MNKASLSQRINPKSSPPFWEMDDSTFEHFSRSLMHEDEHIKYAELYGLRGEKQYGIDIEAERKDGGIDVGQCKCYKAFSHRQISKAATEFIKYWDEVWDSRDVRRFILLVACELSSKKQRDEIAKAGLKARKRGPKSKAVDPRVKQLERENLRLKRRLEQAETIIDFQKKLSKLLGIQLKSPDSDGND